MTTPDPAASNTDLWTTYLRSQMRSWIDPFGIAKPESVDIVARPLADMAAAAVSGWMSLVAAPPVRAIYDGNKAPVTQFVQQARDGDADADATEVPPQYAATRRYPAPTQLEEWGIKSIRPERELTLVR